MKAKILFFGTSERSATFLRLILEKGIEIAKIVSSPPKKSGRKQILTENPTVLAAKEKNIPFQLDLNSLSGYDLGLILDYNRIIPQSVIDRFPKGIINIHFSKLPADRGPARGEQFILRGEVHAWITYGLITAGLDEGPVLTQTSLALTQKETFGELSAKLVQKAASEIEPVIRDYLSGKIIPQPQKGKPTFAKKLTSQDSRINWKWPPEKIERLIRAAQPEPGAWTEVKLKMKNEKLKIKRLKIHKSHLEDGKLVPDLVQLEGKNPVTWRQFQEGYPETELSRQKTDKSRKY